MKPSIVSLVPNHADYRAVKSGIVGHFRKSVSERAFAVYGSSVLSDSKLLDPGTSDVDLFVLEREGSVPPFWALQEFGERSLDFHPHVSVQVNWQTEKTFSSIIGPGPGYLKEVEKGAKARSASKGFLRDLRRELPDEAYESRDEDVDMLRHFYRKLVSTTLRIPKARRRAEYRDATDLYESYKKFFSILAGCVRILEGRSVFWRPKKEIIRASARALDADFNEALLLDFNRRLGNFTQTLNRFENSNLRNVQLEFEQLYAEFEKAYAAILTMNVRLETKKVLVIDR